MQVAGTFRSDQGADLAANWSGAELGDRRAEPAVCRHRRETSITVNLIEPGTLYGDRVNQIDLRFAKILRFGRTRTNVGFDIYNVMNAAPVLTYNQAFVPNGACRPG